MKVYPFLCVLAISCGVASAQTPLLHYTFDETTGDALDTGSGTAANGTLNGGAVRSSNTPSGFGSSVDFQNDSPYAHVLSTDSDKLDGLSTLTLSTWLNVSSYPSGNHRLVAKQSGGAFGGFNFSMNATPNDGTVGADNFRIGLFLGNNVSSGSTDFGAAYSTVDVDAASKWVFLAVTYDSSLATGNTVFYIGGVDTPITQLGSAGTLPQITVDGGTARFGVGFTDAAPTANTSVIGLQDDVRVYGEALTSGDLENIRLQAVPEPSTFAILGGGLAGLLAFRKMRKS